MKRLLPLALLLLCASAAQAFGDRHPHQVDHLDAAQLQWLADEGIDIDHWNGGAWTLWLNHEELLRLSHNGIRAREIPNPVEEAWREWVNRPEGAPRDNFSYRSYTELHDELVADTTAYPEICRLYSIGQSVLGRELLVLQIGDNLDTPSDEPEFRFISTMHGDEVVGTVMLLNLIEDLLEGYGADPRLTTIVDEIDLHILVLMNPDGMEAGSRYNAHGVDLNRDFPDQYTDPVDTFEGREPETVAVMQWTRERNFVLSMNYHGGAVVASYPFDGSASGSPVYSVAPDDDLFIDLALTYSSQNLPMYNSFTWPQGITNGSDWYVIRGSMQDWTYLWEGGLDITLEVSQIKWPSSGTLPGYWNDNRESMLQYVEKSLTGIRGIVRDADSGEPLEAEVALLGVDSRMVSDPEVGDYHRVCLPGTYTLQVRAEGYASAEISGIVVGSGAATVVDVELQFIGLPATLVSEDFADAADWQLDTGWQVDAAQAGGGEHGPPDPAEDTSPTEDNRLLGYQIGGDYENNLAQTRWATSPVYDLGLASNCQLTFQRLLGLERDLYDNGTLQAWDGSQWQTIWENGSTTIEDSGWHEELYDLSEWADGNSAFRLRFGIGPTDAGWRFCGWNIDDLEIRGVLEHTEPQELVLGITVTGAEVQLQWTPLESALSYTVESRASYGEAWNTLGSTTDTSWQLVGELNSHDLRHYRVTADLPAAPTARR